MKSSLIKALGFQCFYFLLGSVLIILPVLGFQHYQDSHVYVVVMGEHELGVVEDALEIEDYVEDLIKRCGDLYGMDIKLRDEITLIKELRPGSMKDTEEVRNKIRQLASFRADAYMINVNGKPLVPVSCSEDLDQVVELLREEYLVAAENSSARILDVILLEDLTLQERAVPPSKIFTPQEAAALLLDRDPINNVSMSDAGPEISLAGSMNSTGSEQNNGVDPAILLAEAVFTSDPQKTISDEVKVSVQTVEEIVVNIAIPFSTEYTYDDKMLIIEEEILEPGQEGEKIMVYHLVRENGIEVERILVEEEIIEEPQDQVIVKGLKKPPSLGGGRFLWPVQGEGIVTNGFSPRHNGIDIFIDHGTNILAADDGIVTYSGYGSTQGNYLILYHGKYWTLYLHNSEHLVSQGDRVTKGQVIAKVGATGRAFGPHLHFEVRVDDRSGKWESYYQHKPVDPLQFFSRRR